MTTETANMTDKDRALMHLEALPKGTRLYCVLKHVSKSGMLREISLHYASGDEVLSATWSASVLTGWKIGKHDGIKVDGAGMDMGFHLVYTLGQILHKDGYWFSQHWL